MKIINSSLSTVYIGNHIVYKILHNLAKATNVFIICDKNIPVTSSTFRKKFTVIFCEHFSENKKNINTVLKIINSLIKHNVKKTDYIAIIGGGAILDTATFACSIFKRGIPFINIPTTFLSAIDSAIGGKNGINFYGIKNIIGTIINPKYIIIDTVFLTSEQINNGIGELIKYAMIGNKKLYTIIKDFKRKATDSRLEKVIFECIKFKLKIVEKDPYDNNIRHILNFGHTTAHLIETLSNFKISHGQAVILGMLIELLYGKKLNLISDSFLSFFYKLLRQFQPLLPDKSILHKCQIISFNQFKKIVLQDKKLLDRKNIVISIPTYFNKYNLFVRIPLKEFYEFFINFNLNTFWCL